MPLARIPFIKIYSDILRISQEVPWFLRQFCVTDLDIRNNQDRRYRVSGSGSYLDIPILIKLRMGELREASEVVSAVGWLKF